MTCLLQMIGNDQCHDCLHSAQCVCRYLKEQARRRQHGGAQVEHRVGHDEVRGRRQPFVGASERAPDGQMKGNKRPKGIGR
jgi:hypothetical protein